MPPVPIDEPLGYRRGRRVSCNEAVGTAPIPHGHAIVNAPPPNHSPQPKDQSVRYGGPYSSTPLFVAGRLRPRCLEPTDDRNGVLRLWPDGVVRVDICRPDPSVLVEPDTVCIPLVMVWPAARESPVLRSFLDLVREHAETIRRMVPGGAAG